MYWFLTIITFGWYHYSKSLKAAAAVLLKAEELSKELTYIPITMCDNNNTEYLRYLSELHNDERWRFFIYDLKQKLLKQLIAGGEKEAVTLQGILKGIQFVESAIETRITKYKSLMELTEE